MTEPYKLNPWINYPESESFNGDIVALADLPAADRILIVTNWDGHCKYWAMLFMRKDGQLHIFNDFGGEDYRRREDKEHCMDYLPEEVIKLASTNRDIHSFVQQLNKSAYYNGFTEGEMVECEHGFYIKTYINISPWEKDCEEKEAALRKLFAQHLGVDLDDLRATGGEWNFGTEQFDNTSPLNTVPLSPLTPIPINSPFRRKFWECVV